MLPKAVRALYYSVTGPAMKLNAARLRLSDRPSVGGAAVRKVHLGPGREKYIAGWVNCDANIITGKADRWIDLRNPLPFGDNSVDAIYSHHVVEHLPNIQAHLSEAARVLKPGGVYRIGGPDADMAIDRFIARDVDWFDDWPDKRRSAGGRMDNFLLCRGEHVALLTEDFLTELLEDAGFAPIQRVAPRQSNHPHLFSDVFRFEEEPSERPRTLLIEAVKPEAPSA